MCCSVQCFIQYLVIISCKVYSCQIIIIIILCHHYHIIILRSSLINT